ncbi:SIS domain-containing protein [Dothidotthia symphoricarpi CBS 119687]|uniref:SIS domain-containing protein n=1 Tax=Dothidotthia symphoricarpi CBS 119687 TaxID=1392245 RepID=A0A6A5ZVK6_9PLEO|nr:SIS domain-containing protein [Dothidotthia symphoricarpi CBS 119687]KAF2123559.1 SIS domain-containing protein [Dothidotthia symphoricarpi CBS 119687]
MATILETTPPCELLSPVSHKRKRADSETQPLTPPLTTTDPEGTRLLSRAVAVLSTAATALSQVTILYQCDPVARDGLLRAVECLAGVNEAGGKLIVCGVGKSGLVGRKMVATMKSLGIASSFMHAAEALHGDLGDIRKNDAIMFISYSGKTAELMALLDHIPSHTPILAVTSHTHPSECQLLNERPSAILLPAPIHELEETSFGVCAPTTSTTVTIAVGDMLALTVAEALYEGETTSVFRKNHPGGAIGDKAKRKVQDVESSISFKRQRGMITPPAL